MAISFPEKQRKALLPYHFNNHTDRLIPSKQKSRNEAAAILSPQCRIVEQIEEPEADVHDGVYEEGGKGEAFLVMSC